MRACYQSWNDELERLGIEFMLSGHLHKTQIVEADGSLNTLPHNYLVIIGAAYLEEDIWGTALILNKNGMEVRFTDKNRTVREKFVIDL